MRRNYKDLKPIIESNSMNLEQIIENIFENLSEGVLITDQQLNILYVNAFFESLTGYRSEEVIGKKPKILQSGVHDPTYYKKMWESINEFGFWQGEIWNRQKCGALYPEWLKVIAVKNAKGEVVNYIGIFSDLSEKKHVEHELEEKTLTDGLTNVNNRHSFLIKMNQLLESSTFSNNQTQHAVLYIDINRFKQVNDTLGHAIGDLLLVEIAKRLQQLVSDKDILARHVGDKFLITLANIEHPRDATKLAKNIIREIEMPFHINGHEIYMSTSIGISLYPIDGKTTDELIYCADKAMYYAKQTVMNGFSFYFDDLNKDMSRVLTLDSEIRKAIKNKQFTLYYQPKLCLQTNKILGMEALIRWENEKLGNVPPDEFIAYAEESGLIVPLSELLFELACEGLKKIHDAGFTNVNVAINVSSLHFQQHNFLDSIKGILDKNNMLAKDLELEVTERTVMTNDLDTINKLIHLKQLGFKLSIDDFGMGYSSLSYLVRFPIDYLKIDQSFIQNLTEQEDKQAIVDAIIQMAHRLRLKVVAEGVENIRQYKYLKKIECDYIQGYYFCKPLPINDIIDFLNYWEIEHQGWI